jgi:hypothetical protein
MYGYLIDPNTRTVNKVEYDGSLESIYTLLDCEMIEAAPINDQADSSVYVDEESLMKLSDDETVHAFQFIGGHQPLIGKGLVIGPPDDEGNTTEPDDIDINWIMNKVFFGTLRF